MREKERELQAQYKIDARAHTNKQSAYKMAEKAALKSDDDIEAALDALGVVPAAPLEPKLLTNDFTFEGIFKQLSKAQPSAGIFMDEAGTLFGGHAMHKDNKLKTITGMSKLWDASQIDRTRSTDGMEFISDKRLTVHLMMQPIIAQQVFGDSLLDGQGFLSRYLTVFPESMKGTRTVKAGYRPDTAALEAFNTCLKSILDKPLPIKKGTRSDLNPRTLEMDKGAEEALVHFYNSVETGQLQFGEFENIAAFASKIMENTVRIAGVLTLFDDINATFITKDMMQRAIVLGNHYIDEAVRILEAKFTDPDIILAERAINWLKNKWEYPYISPANFQQRMKIKSGAAYKIISILTSHNYLIPCEGDMIIENENRRNVWMINPSI